MNIEKERELHSKRYIFVKENLSTMSRPYEIPVQIGTYYAESRADKLS